MRFSDWFQWARWAGGPQGDLESRCLNVWEPWAVTQVPENMAPPGFLSQQPEISPEHLSCRTSPLPLEFPELEIPTPEAEVIRLGCTFLWVGLSG